ncbi:MAG: single-stranded-DNA-specific exonuclease RecJ [Parcubacteria group bacterium]|jgi:single-stranded-DNA-specific exonuclease|nr:single-stranded-DNA-specific exonuclease RecJ [Parcubacteria group bacterium]|tara:strand:+ start:5636 stop:7381 length:1746 start_codon:yes stop_codon:yes gene_type:complete
MKWQVKSKAPRAFFKQFPEFSPLIVQLFYNRGFKTQKQVDEFFNPDFEGDLHDPYLLKDMDLAVKRIVKAIDHQEKILIYGDFDADGVSATTILYKTLESFGLTPEIYIPDREKENHGLNPKSIKVIAKDKINLLITVDCGSKDFEAIDLANSLGIDVVITDHHDTDQKLPQTVALINHKRKDDKYPFKDLAGAGVAYKLALALLLIKGDPDNLKKWLLDITALATVADMEPIIGENRTIVKYGLGVLAQTKWIGLAKLMDVSRINPEIVNHSAKGEAPLTNLDASTLGFALGPRINAAGRMEHANIAFELLTTGNEQKAEKLAQLIDQKNKERQTLTDKVVREVEARIVSQDRIPELIFEGDKDWPVGLIGLIAGKMKDKFNRPAVIYNDQQKIIRASCRSIPQFDLMNMLNQCSRYFDDYGGRDGTGGFTMSRDKIEKVKDICFKLAKKELKKISLNSVLEIDAELSLEEISFKNHDQVSLFEPFGKKNLKPKFLAKSLEIMEARLVGNGQKHLKMELAMFDKYSGKGKNFKAIGFSLVDKVEEVKKGDLVDVVFEMIINQWNGYKELEMKIVDLKLIK